MKKPKYEHRYTKYRPDWCHHGPFRGMDYCWGLASAVDAGTLEDWLEGKCETCDCSDFYIGDKEFERRFGEKE